MELRLFVYQVENGQVLSRLRRTGRRLRALTRVRYVRNPRDKKYKMMTSIELIRHQTIVV